MQAQPLRFREAKRIQQSFLAVLEKKTLLWLAARTPPWINSDHLTLLGLLAMAGAGAGYWWASVNRMGLIVVIVCLAHLGSAVRGGVRRANPLAVTGTVLLATPPRDASSNAGLLPPWQRSILQTRSHTS